MGTGGAFENGKDAENFFFNPKANNFLGIVDEATGKETGLFLSGVYRQDSKEVSSLGEWLSTVQGIEVSKDSELYNIPFYFEISKNTLFFILNIYYLNLIQNLMLAAVGLAFRML